ncbi:MAG: 2-amino-4-hydroxy-6-hydroxymethyldihydropteridine diphosphokinase [Leptospirillia bacterium]
MSDHEIIAYVGIGANLGEREASCRAAALALGGIDGVRLLGTSRWRETAPVGPVPQGAFINGVVELSTTLSPEALLAACLAIESDMGRVRDLRWGPRTIDLDLLLYGDAVIQRPGLSVPHPEMHRRGFVMEPLAELAPERVHPVLGETMTALRDRLTRKQEVVT